MMKLTISIDEFKKEFGQFDSDLDHGAQVMEALTDMLCDFLEYQFPEWDLTNEIEKAEWDF